MLTLLVVSSLFQVGDGIGWIEKWFGVRIPDGTQYTAAFIIFGYFAIKKIVDLQTSLDMLNQRIRIIAQPGTYAWNSPDPGRDKVSLRTSVHWQIWTDMDAATAQLALNVVAVQQWSWRRPWLLWRSREKALFRLHPNKQDSPNYRRSLKASDQQPFEDSAEFEYVGPMDGYYGDYLRLDLVLVTGSPSGRFVAVVDPRLAEHGSTTPL